MTIEIPFLVLGSGLLLDLFDKDLGRFETGYVVSRDDDGFVLGDDPAYFFFAMLHNETTESTDIDILSTRQSILYNSKETFQRCRYISLVNACLLGDFYDYFCLSHVDLIY
jgi:hypothetical protein